MRRGRRAWNTNTNIPFPRLIFVQIPASNLNFAYNQVQIPASNLNFAYSQELIPNRFLIKRIPNGQVFREREFTDATFARKMYGFIGQA